MLKIQLKLGFASVFSNFVFAINFEIFRKSNNGSSRNFCETSNLLSGNISLSDNLGNNSLLLRFTDTMFRVIWEKRTRFLQNKNTSEASVSNLNCKLDGQIGDIVVYMLWVLLGVVSAGCEVQTCSEAGSRHAQVQLSAGDADDPAGAGKVPDDAGASVRRLSQYQVSTGVCVCVCEWVSTWRACACFCRVVQVYVCVFCAALVAKSAEFKLSAETQLELLLRQCDNKTARNLFLFCSLWFVVLMASECLSCCFCFLFLRFENPSFPFCWTKLQLWSTHKTSIQSIHAQPNLKTVSRFYLWKTQNLRSLFVQPALRPQDFRGTVGKADLVVVLLFLFCLHTDWLWFHAFLFCTRAYRIFPWNPTPQSVRRKSVKHNMKGKRKCNCKKQTKMKNMGGMQFAMYEDEKCDWCPRVKYDAC